MDPLSRILKQINENVKARPFSGLVDSLHLFEEIIDGNLHMRALNALLRQFGTTADSIDIFTSGKFLVLASCNEVELSLIRYSGATDFIYSSPTSFMQSKVSDGEAVCDYYSSDEKLSAAMFDETAAISRSGSRRFGDGALFAKSLEDIIYLHSFTPKTTVFLPIGKAHGLNPIT